MRNAHKILIGKPERRRPIEIRYVKVDKTIILKWRGYG
jgi:hypothetical protein